MLKIRFSSIPQALQYLSDHTGKRIVIAKPILDVSKALQKIRQRDESDLEQHRYIVEKKDPKESKLEASLKKLDELVKKAKDENEFVELLDKFGSSYFYPIDINRKEFSGLSGKKKFYQTVKEKGIENIPVNL